MSNLAIKIENLSKQYRLGVISSGTLSHDIQRWWIVNILGKDDPYLKIGDIYDNSKNKASNYIWALKDVNVDIKKGEVIGIIGKNGAGKSTLLKILSRITKPTTGNIKYNGRIASLLEVGTGFHPEMTGRENIYMNGTIMGMTKTEITQKLDEIIEFAGIKSYIDTPVKRYSSGMTVRLGFSIAAHLEPDILVVDEVLAVGDAEFQKKAIGKMKDVSRADGRTVLFVSHNMTAIKSLCESGILLERGKITFHGRAIDTVEEYLKKELAIIDQKEFTTPESAPGNDFVRLNKCYINPILNQGKKNIDVSTPINIYFDFWLIKSNCLINLSLHLYNINGEMVFNIHTPLIFQSDYLIKTICQIPGNILNDGMYYVDMMIVKDGTTPIFNFKECIQFSVVDYREGYNWHGKWQGIVRPTFIPFNFINR